MSVNFQTLYGRYLKTFNAALRERCEKMDFFPNVLTESMRYSLEAGGKRVRPVLFLAALDAYGFDFTKETELALAIEFVHTYSLIHDDLPCMDNDDFRRGKLSNHKMFGEANAVLAGDALLSYGFDLALKEAERGANYLKAAQILSKAAGVEGMVSGQSFDLFYTGKTLGENELLTVYRKKTGALMSAPIEMAAVIAGRDSDSAKRFGENLGMLFQLTDDLLDVLGDRVSLGKTLGKDQRENKLTCVKVFGMARSQALADEFAGKCRAALQDFGGDTDFLSRLIDYIRSRKN